MFVVANSSDEAHAANKNQSARTPTPGMISGEIKPWFGSSEASSKDRAVQAHHAQPIANRQKATDQHVPRVRIRRAGSSTNGKVSSPSNEPRFDTEYRRYVWLWRERPNQACNRGAVVERTKNGRPAEIRITSATSRVGAAPDLGLQKILGVIAVGQIKDKAAISRAASNNKPRCTLSWLEGFRREETR